MNIPVLLGLTWTQATSPMNWQHITNDIHIGQHKPNFPSNSWLNSLAHDFYTELSENGYYLLHEADSQSWSL